MNQDNAVAEALVDRLAQADKPTRELLEEVYQAANGGRLFLDPGSGGFKQSYTRWLRYQHMLDAEAWTSAVEMLTGKESTALADAIACLKARGL